LSRYEYEDGLIQLSVARSLLDELASRAVTSRDQALATSFADEIGPEIRYCAHELGRSKAYDIDGIVKEVASQHRNEIVPGYDRLISKLVEENAGGADGEKKKLKPVVWEDEPVPVRNPELVDVLLKVQDAEEKLKQAEQDQIEKHTSEAKEGEKKGRVGKGTRSKKGVAAYDAILLALSDAEGVARKLVEAQQLSAGSSNTPTGTRDMQFVHAYIIYQLLSRRIQRDLLLISTLLHQSQSSSSHVHNVAKQDKKPTAARKEQKVDARLFPAVVKLLDTILQSLNQMRTLSIVDDSPDLASAVDARICFTKARRCRYLARCYTPVKKFAESLTLIQHGTIHLRETSSLLSILDSDSDPISSPDQPNFYLLSASEVEALEEELDTDSIQTKKDWFTFNGGLLDSNTTGLGKTTQKKPLFFDIALNYAQLDMDRLQERAGKKVIPVIPSVPPPSSSAAVTPTVKVHPVKSEREDSQKKKLGTGTAKVEEIEREPTPEPVSAGARGGLSSLLGGWWGRK